MLSPDELYALRIKLEKLYNEQESDEWPLAKQKLIRKEIDKVEQQLREALR